MRSRKLKVHRGGIVGVLMQLMWPLVVGRQPCAAFYTGLDGAGGLILTGLLE